MIAKEELLKKIKEAMWDEERTFPIQKKHVLHSLLWYGFSEEENQTIRDVLQRLSDETEEHAKTLQTLYDEVSGGDRDVY